jgi:hypothetical protein
MPKHLTIDTNIATAASESGKKDAEICREFLEEVMTSLHLVVMTEKILAEWRKYQSTYSRQWLAAMVSRRQVHKLDLALENFSVYQRCEEIEKYIKGLSDEDGRKAMLEDFLLIKAALATDKIIVSHDHEARSFFVKLSQTGPELQLIMRKSPWKQDTKRWIKADAKIQKRYCLGFGISKAEKSV